MSLQVCCPGCATKLSIKQEMLGKQIRCPSCKKVMALGPPKGKSQSAPAVKPKPPMKKTGPVNAESSSGESSSDKAKKILIGCACGSKLKVPASAAGKRVKCPKCSDLIVVPTGKAPAPKAKIDPTAAVGSVAAADPLGEPNPSSPFDDFGTDPDETDPFAGAPDDDPFGDIGLPDAAAPMPASGSVTKFATPTAQSNPFAKKANSDEAALAAAGGYEPSLEDKMGAAVAATNQPDDDSFLGAIAGRVVLLLWLMVIAGPIMTVVGCKTRQKLAALEQNGISVPGVIISGHERRGRKGRRSYYLDIAFKVEGGEPIVKEFPVSGSFYREPSSGDGDEAEIVEVVYNPDDPDEAIVVGGSTDSPMTMFIGMGVTVVGLLGVAASFFIQIE